MKPMRNEDFPWVDRALHSFDTAVFNFIMRHGGYPARHPMRFRTGWWVNDHICVPLYRWRRRITRLQP